jgi:hypothetical protein
MNIPEKELENILWDFITRGKFDKLGKKIGFSLHPQWDYHRQLHMGEYGTADIVGLSYTGDALGVHVIELKKDTVNHDTFFQAVRYLNAFKRFADDNDILIVESHITLIGSRITSDPSFRHIAGFINAVSLFTYDYSPIKGLSLREVPPLGQSEDPQIKPDYGITKNILNQYTK